LITRAVELAERLGEREILVHALNNLGTMGFLLEAPGGREQLERSLRLALEEGFEEHAARAYIHLGWAATRVHSYALAGDYIRDSISFCTEHDLRVYRHYPFAHRARLELDRGCWDDAAESAMEVIDDPLSSPDARVPALGVLGLVRSRRGDPEQWSPLEEARAVECECDVKLERVASVAGAWAEALWLEGRRAEIDEVTRRPMSLDSRTSQRSGGRCARPAISTRGGT
jgi:hypothetical protein